MTHDVTLDNQLSATALLSLAEKYHAFSGSSLVNFTLPTSSDSYAPYGGESIEVVDEPAAAEMISQFLGGSPDRASTPPLDQNGDPENTSVPTSTAPPSTCLLYTSPGTPGRGLQPVVRGRGGHQPSRAGRHTVRRQDRRLGLFHQDVYKRQAHESALTAYALRALDEKLGPDCHVFGPPAGPDRGGVLSIAYRDVHAHDLAQVLDQFGVCVRPGHHCAKPLMRKLGVQATARASLSLFSDEHDIEVLIEGLVAVSYTHLDVYKRQGLQHDDGHSPLLASTNPAAMIYDASFAYEVAVIMQDAITRILGPDPEDRFWYLTLYNETYPMPALPEGEEGAAISRRCV